MSVPKLWSLHHILLLSVFTGAANGYYNYYWSQCIYSSSDFSDMVFLIDYYFNKYLYVQFNSNVGEFVGFTEVGVRTAENLNKDTALLQQLKAEVERVCKHNAVLYKTAIHDKAVAPQVKLSLVKQGDSRHPSLLMCSAYDFNVSWLRDGVVVTSDVTFTEKMPNGDWYHQIHNELEYTPKAGEKISCMVEHAGFTKPMIYDWMMCDPPLLEFEGNTLLLFTAGAAGSS
ncbi:HLA class II histocompatibility antigen, DP beta 1 chain-like [Sinocyclocheilus anshuiensis]|uniref:HLA class II histocompatibility antigen, DP beta 1 chain-like n=1 Tax=Sinocyclocheilus anshuiensis TaxID=1608454 RepID=UPI0007BAA43E|nr:PREDICTED: HLA class II histocompatibility antigen, DP beta 1 chain-like [Sinocyclocheilus anshuiensis]